MAKPKTRTRKPTTTRKSKSKKAAKKTVKKAAKKMAAKKVKEPRAKREKVEKPSIKTIYENIKLLRYEVAGLEHTLQLIRQRVNDLPFPKSNIGGSSENLQNNTQMDLFNGVSSDAPDLKSNGNGSGPTLTKEDVTQALQEVMSKRGTDQVKEILGMHNAKKISDLTPNQWASCYKMCQENMQS